MGRAALEFVKDLVIGKKIDVRNTVEIARVPGKSGIHPVKDAAAGHKGFSRAALFPRAAEIFNGTLLPVFLQIFLQSDSGPQRARAEKIVTAAVAVAPFANGLLFGGAGLLAHSRKSVELTEEADHRVTRPPSANERGGNLRHTFFNAETETSQRFADAVHRLEFLESGLGVVPDMVAHIAEHRPVFLKEFIHLLFVHKMTSFFRLHCPCTQNAQKEKGKSPFPVSGLP